MRDRTDPGQASEGGLGDKSLKRQEKPQHVHPMVEQEEPEWENASRGRRPNRIENPDSIRERQTGSGWRSRRPKEEKEELQGTRRS